MTAAEDERSAPRRMILTTTTATTMAAITLAERDFLLAPAVGLAVERVCGVADGSGDSCGNGSPGLSMYALSLASCCRLIIGVLALGLMAPTMP